MLALKMPASKSMSHRLLMAAALSQGTSIVHNVLLSKDIECTMQVLSAVGAKFRQADDSFIVDGMGRPKGMSSEAIACYMHESGTSCRLLMAILGAGQGKFYLHGAPRLHERPVGSLAKALEELGVKIDYENKFGYLPLTICTEGFKAESTHINIDESSQYLSGLLLAAACSGSDRTIYLEGKSVVSWPYVALTLSTLQKFGINVQMQEQVEKQWQDVHWQTLQDIVPQKIRFIVPSSSFAPGEYTVEGDWSAASYFLAAGLIGEKSLRIQGLEKNSMQGDKAMLEIISAMQGQYSWDGSDIIINPSPLKGINVDMGHCPDLVPTVAMLAAFAQGSTTISNVRHLRIKESDRIAAPAKELAKVGVQVDMFEDGLCVHGLGHAPIISKDLVFSAHNDHRIAMSCALFGLNGQAVNIDEPGVVQKSFPHFWQLWERLK